MGSSFSKPKNTAKPAAASATPAPAPAVESPPPAPEPVAPAAPAMEEPPNDKEEAEKCDADFKKKLSSMLYVPLGDLNETLDMTTDETKIKNKSENYNKAKTEFENITNECYSKLVKAGIESNSNVVKFINNKKYVKEFNDNKVTIKSAEDIIAERLPATAGGGKRKSKRRRGSATAAAKKSRKQRRKKLRASPVLPPRRCRVKN